MSNVPPAEVSEIDANARCSLSLLVAFALFWLLVSGAFSLISLGQSLDPAFLAGCPAFTFGHVRYLQETTFIYGWVANVGFAIALWLLGRLGGAPLRSLNWACAGTVFWNVGVLVGAIGIVTGDATSVAYLHLPRYVQPLLLVAFGAIAVPGVLAWTGRNRPATFAAQWYAVAALFLFPWLFSAAQVALMWAPLRGVLQAVTAGWFVQSVWSLWLAPLALAAAYYLVPKISGRVTPAYDFASYGFWTLLFVGSWTGARQLIGGPVPAWIASIAIAACWLMLFHYIVVALNLRGAFGQRSLPLQFVAFGVLAYVVGGIADAVTALRSVAEVTQFTWITQAQSQLALYGAFSMIAFGALYFLLPRVKLAPWPSMAFIRAHYITSLVGTVTSVALLATAGYVQSKGLANASLSFADVNHQVRPWLLATSAAQGLLVAGNFFLALNFVRLVLAKPAANAANLFRQPAVMEASVS